MVEISTPQDVVSVVGQELNVVVVGQEVIETPVYENPLKGKDGRDGVDGKDGRDGIDGVNGRDGIDGRDGRDGRDGKDGLNGINSWIENIDDTLYFRNDGGLPEPKPVKLKEKIKAWGFGTGRGGGQLPADWNQKDKNNPTFIKNKPNIAGMISTAVHNHDVDLESHADIRADIDVLDNKIDESLVPKSVNALIFGEPTIQNSQVNGFSSSNYLALPFLFDVGERAFELTYSFRTTDNVTTPQNLFGSNYCIASYISNGNLTVRVSGNGTSWNVLDIQTSLEIKQNSIYYVKLIFNRLNYTIKASTDGVNYSQVGYVVNTTKPYAGDVYIGVGNNKNNPFLGIIYLNKWELKYNNSVFWEGMDDAGLNTRADISLSNLDAEGQARFDAKQDVINDLESIRSGASLGSTALQIGNNVSGLTNDIGYLTLDTLPVYDGSSE